MQRYYKKIPKYRESNTNDSLPTVDTNEKEANNVPFTTSIKKQSDKKKNNYLVRIKASPRAAKYLLRGGLAFRAHDESDDSSYKRNFHELIEVLGLNNEETCRVVLKNAPKNHKMTSPDIQKEPVNACAVETINKIVNEIGYNNFSVLVDESGDGAGKEQMVVVARYIDDKGFVVERFIGYDGPSNMRGRFRGLKALIQKDNPNAYYVHCFAHQLQLALIVVGREQPGVKLFFGVVTCVVNVIKSSNKRQDLLREHQESHVANLMEEGFIETGWGLNQEMSLSRADDTRWGSHYNS
ncbi:hypothetical protein LIER_27469 [Lithospermum erythrorhizon]|uniref:DUF4371 domain-containing protein n=1 Tax=Lithospermum erythrorhizon TaxID=34254 RepID=A0AAV3RE62_LITER